MMKMKIPKKVNRRTYAPLRCVRLSKKEKRDLSYAGSWLEDTLDGGGLAVSEIKKKASQSGLDWPVVRLALLAAGYIESRDAPGSPVWWTPSADVGRDLHRAVGAALDRLRMLMWDLEMTACNTRPTDMIPDVLADHFVFSAPGKDSAEAALGKVKKLIREIEATASDESRATAQVPALPRPAISEQPAPPDPVAVPSARQTGARPNDP